MRRPTKEVREDVFLSWPMPEIVLVQLQIPTEQLLVMGGHPPYEQQRAMIDVHPDWS